MSDNASIDTRNVQNVKKAELQRDFYLELVTNESDGSKREKVVAIGNLGPLLDG